MENIIAVIIFIIAIVGIIALAAYKMYKNNNKTLTIDEFLKEYYDNLINALQDVVSLLLIKIDNYPDKETYEKAIISTTLEKLNENCIEFGIDATILNLFDSEILTNMLYNLLHNEEIFIFSSTVPKDVMQAKPELYDESVIEASEYLD